MATTDHFGVSVGGIVFAANPHPSTSVFGAAPGGIPQFMKDEADKVDDRGQLSLDEFEDVIDITKYTKHSNKALTDEELEILNTEESKAVDPGVIYLQVDPNEAPATQEEIDFVNNFNYDLLRDEFTIPESDMAKAREYTGPRIVIDQTYQQLIADLANDDESDDESDDEPDDEPYEPDETDETDDEID